MLFERLISLGKESKLFSFLRNSKFFSGSKKSDSGTFHIVWDTDASKWLVKKDGENSPVSNHETKKSAMDAGKKLSARLSDGKIIIYKMDGEVQKSIVVNKNAA